MTHILNHIQNEVTTLAMCWKLKLRNGKQFGFTNHDRNLVIEDLEYLSSSGFTASAISSNSSMNVDNMDVYGIIDHAVISEQDILSGIYDHAEVHVFLINYTAIHEGKINLRKGWLGEIKMEKQNFIAEVRGMLQAFNAKICDIYSPNCRVNFGDKYCKIDLKKYTLYNLKISKVIDRSNFIFINEKIFDNKITDGETINVETIDAKDIKIDENTKLIEDTKIFTNGSILFNNGFNSGLKMEVKSCNGSHVQLVLPMPYNISINDTFDIIAGCSKTIGSCAKFNNVFNFRGYPHIPNPTSIKN